MKFFSNLLGGSRENMLSTYSTQSEMNIPPSPAVSHRNVATLHNGYPPSYGYPPNGNPHGYPDLSLRNYQTEPLRSSKRPPVVGSDRKHHGERSGKDSSMKRSVSLSKMFTRSTNFENSNNGQARRCMSPPQPVTSSEFPMSASSAASSSAHPLSTIRDPTLLAHYDRLAEALENSNNKMDEEHRLIARYAAKLAQETLNALSGRPGTTVNSSLHSSNIEMNKNQKQREILADLHQKNRDIMREIARLKEERDETSRMTSLAAAAGGIHPMAASGHLLQGARSNNPSLMQELRSLRQRKEELEQRMACLQESRRELMVQLESLMKMLRTNQNVVPNSTPSQTLGNFSSTSNTTGSSPNNSGHYTQQKLSGSMISAAANQNAYLGDQGQTVSSAMYNATQSSAVSMATTLPRTMTGVSTVPPAGATNPNTGPQHQQQLHQELLISAENASHAAIDLLSKLSLGIAPDMDPSAINTFAYYPYAGQQTTASVGVKSDLVSATAAALAHHQMFTNNNQLQQGAINNPQSAVVAAQYPNTAPPLPQHTMPSYLGASSGGTGGIMSASGPISHQSGGSIYPHGAGAGAAQQQMGMSPAANLGNICT